jgi:sodium/potassium-transporting ATPase subunit alpha
VSEERILKLTGLKIYNLFLAVAMSVNRQVSEASLVYLQQFKEQFEEQEQINLAMMDADKKTLKERLMFWKKGAKGDFASKALDNDKVRDMDTHKITLQELEDRFDTHVNADGTNDRGPQGLSEDKATMKLEKHGKNALTEKKAKKWYVLFIEELTGFFSLLLWFGSFLCFFGYILDSSDPSNLYLGIVLAVVTLVTGIFSYFQTSKSAALMAQFKDFIPQKTMVIRNGDEKEVKAANLVPGDVVKIKGGDNVPADVRILDCYEMKVNNASLTGESEDLLRGAESSADNPLETMNLAFFGTQCTQGVGTAVVIETGDKTVIGQIANLAQSASGEETPLSIEINRFIKIVSGVAIFLGVTFLILGFIYGYDPITNLVFMIGIIVANVPEGLLATVTVSLALTAKRMAKKKVLVKNLESVETLGSTTCICSDKTGTLTQNRMTVSHVWFNCEMRDASVNYEQLVKGLAKKEDLDYDVENPEFKELNRTVTLGTKAFFDFTPDEEQVNRVIGKMIRKKPKKVNKDDVAKHGEKAIAKLKEEEDKKSYQWRSTAGDASESGLIKFVQPINSIEEEREKFPIWTCKDDKGEPVTCEIPFNSINKYNLIIRDMQKSTEPEDQADPKRKNFLLIMKGAPERIWGRCSHILVNGEEVEINDAHRKQYDDANAELGGQGERVLAFARVYLDASQFPREYAFNFDKGAYNFPMENLCFVGLVSLNDPPRVFVDHSVDKCRAAGIKVIMVTGDQPVTAAAIAKKVNIIREGSVANVDLIAQG